MDRSIFTALVLLVPIWLCMLYSQLAWSYPTPVDFSHQLLRWPLSPSSPTLYYDVIAEDPGDITVYGEVIYEAAMLWSNIEESLLRLEAASEHETHADIRVHLQKNLSNSAFSSGYAEFDKVSDSGEPEHCNIYIWVADGFSFEAIAKTILHEMGHCLGLGHSLFPEAIMSYHLSRNQFALDTDDRAAIARLYPLHGRPQLAPGCAIGLQVNGGQSFSLALWLCFALPLLVLGLYSYLLSGANYRPIFTPSTGRRKR